MVSIHDVARSSGVSTATVSRALRGLPNVSVSTRERVQDAADALGYVPSPTASALSSGRTGAVAVVVPSLTRWFYTEVVEGVDATLHQEGYDTLLVDLAIGPGERERLFSHTLLRKRADAVIALGIRFTDAERRELQSLPVPVVIVGAPVPGIRSIGIDDAAASRLALSHLIGLGHRRIGHIGGHDEFGLDRTVAELREQAWRARCESVGCLRRAAGSRQGASSSLSPRRSRSRCSPHPTDRPPSSRVPTRRRSASCWRHDESASGFPRISPSSASTTIPGAPRSTSPRCGRSPMSKAPPRGGSHSQS